MPDPAFERYTVTVTIEVDRARLAEHDSDYRPPPAVVADWNASDLLEAIRLDYAEVKGDSQPLDWRFQPLSEGPPMTE